MKAEWKDAVIAQSDETIVVEGNHYFPPETLNRDNFQASDHHSICGWKGRASYFHVVVDGQVNENAAWYYPDPKPAAEHVRGRIAFWRGVQVRA